MALNTFPLYLYYFLHVNIVCVQLNVYSDIDQFLIGVVHANMHRFKKKTPQTSENYFDVLSNYSDFSAI